MHYGGAESLQGRRITAGGAEKSRHCTFFNTVNLPSKELRFDHRGAKLRPWGRRFDQGSAEFVFCPGRHITSLRPCPDHMHFITFKFQTAIEVHKHSSTNFEVGHTVAKSKVALKRFMFLCELELKKHSRRDILWQRKQYSKSQIKQLWTVFSLRKIYTEQTLVLVRMQLHNLVDTQLVKRFKQ